MQPTSSRATRARRRATQRRLVSKHRVNIALAAFRSAPTYGDVTPYALQLALPWLVLPFAAVAYISIRRSR